MALASIAVGADALLIEVHHDPDKVGWGAVALSEEVWN
jgi:3-deoxy-D-arabino-heptulosonate 7-phosphate (DAHP) synthase